MDSQIPSAAWSLVSFLIAECGCVAESGSTDLASFGNMVLVIRGENLSVRIVRDRDQWFVQIMVTKRPDEWRDLVLLREQTSGRRAQAAMSFDEEVAFLRAHWHTMAGAAESSGWSGILTELARRRGRDEG